MKVNKLTAGMIGLAFILITKAAFASDTFVNNGNCTGTVMTGKEVVETLIKNPKAKIIKYSEVELSEKTGKVKNKSNR